jgi:hypothetical protein
VGESENDGSDSENICKYEYAKNKKSKSALSVATLWPAYEVLSKELLGKAVKIPNYNHIYICM